MESFTATADAADAAASSCKGVVWCILSQLPDTWTPVWCCDNEKLEAAFQKKESNVPIVIRNTHATAYLNNRTVTEAYTGNTEEKPLRRTLWYYVFNGKRIPFQEDANAVIEEWKINSQVNGIRL
jgi:hypothetical protein